METEDASVHCEHCWEGCDGLGEVDQLPHRDVDRCEWYDGCCPYCTERDRIVARLVTWATHYRSMEKMFRDCAEQTPLLWDGQQFFQGAAEAIEWQLANIAGMSFKWLDG